MITADSLLDQLAERGIEIWGEGKRLRYRAPEGCLTGDLRDELRERRDELLRSWRQRAATERRSLPASWMQLGLWLVHHAAPASSAYHVAFTARIVSSIDVDALKAALQGLTDRHAILRTTYGTSDEDLIQVVAGHQPSDFTLIDATDESDDQLHGQIRREYERPFDLSAGPMMRARLFVRGPESRILLIVWHHIAVDGWSAWILLDELRTLYAAEATGAALPVTRSPATYADFTRWQTDLLASSRGEELWSYWEQQLAGAEPTPSIADRPRRPTGVARGRSFRFQLGSETIDRVKALAAADAVSLFVVLLAAFKALLFRYTGQTDLTVGTPTFGRNRAEFQELVGDLINTVPLRTQFSGTMTFRDLVAQVRQTTLGALEHADYPFALLVRRLGLRREPGRSPLFDVLFSFQTPQRADDLVDLFLPSNSETPVRVATGGLVLEPYAFAQQEGQFDLTLEAIETSQGLAANLKYREDLFERSSIERFARDWTRLLETVGAAPDTRLADLSLASEEDRRRIDGWNDTASPVPLPHTIHALVERQAAATPDAIALADGQRTFTYDVLNRHANAVAAHLRRSGVEPGSRVGIVVERSVNVVAGILGILKAGAAYVPLDPANPPERLAHMVADSKAQRVVIERGAMASPDDKTPPNVLFLEDCFDGVDVGASEPIAVSGDDVAYLIYTSGSTGTAKAVAVSHRSVVSMLDAYRDRFAMSPADRWVAVASFAFDASVFEVIGTLATGGSIFVASRADITDGARLAAVIRDWRANRLHGTPSILQILLDANWHGDPTLTIILGGEAVANELASRLLPRCQRLFNVYGPTETTIVATGSEITDAAAPIVIGRPFANVRTYILDAERRMVPIGMTGELWIAGAGVGIGYEGQPALTAERFLPDPFDATPGARMYRTGDLARWRDTGDLECLGRLDHQVKVRGNRVELGEIENAIERHPRVRKAAVAVNGTGSTKQLVAYVVVSAPLEAGDLRRFLRDRLPDYMLPGFVQVVDRFPLTTGGKVDRRRLPAVDLTERTIVAPRSELEASLLRLWEDALDVRPISVTDNFFDLGGHSLLATRLCGRIAQVTGRRPHVATLLQAPTIAELARRLEEDAVTDPPWLVPMGPGGSGTPYFCLPGGGDNAFIFVDLARHLSAERPVYSFRYPDREAVAGMTPREAISTVARRMIAEMRGVQPAGPYLLGGYCVGGLLAFEMAAQLQDAGESVSLTVFETYLPGGFRMARLRDRVSHQWTHMQQLSWPGRAMFLARLAGRRAARALRRVAPQMGNDVLPWMYDATYAPPRPIDGRLTLFSGREAMAGLIVDPQMGWRGLSRDIVVHEIAGHHTDAYKEPHVSAWVDVLRAALVDTV